MKVFYGIETNYIDVTDVCLNKCLVDGNICIPSNDVNRYDLFNDHIPGVCKIIKMIDNNNTIKYFYENDEIVVNLNQLFIENSFKKVYIDQYYKNIYEYERNIPEQYLKKFEEYNAKNTENLNFNYMKKNINKDLFVNTVFDILIPQDTFRYYYLKLMTIDLLLNKSLSFKCLKSNKIFRTTKSMYYLAKNKPCTAGDNDDINIYIYDEAAEPFIVAMGGGSNHMVLHTCILFVYYYKSNELYCLPDFGHWDVSFHEIVYQLRDDLLKENYENKVENAFMFCYSVNIGHSYWNDFSGFKFLVDMDLLKYIDKFIIGPYDYYYIKDYLTKNNYKNIVNEYHIENINEICKNAIIFKYNEMFMYEDLKNFTIENIKETTNETQENEIETIKQNFYPIITFNLRGVYRNLYNQEEVISSIINYLLLIFPNMFIIFDGFIVNDNTKLDFFKSEGVVSNLQVFTESYENILNNIIGKINTTNFKSLIGTNLYNQLNWLEISHYGLMQLGAGSFNYTWTMNKKCIYVGRNNFVNNSLLIHTYHDFIFRENRDFTTYINPNIVDFNTKPNGQFSIDFKIILYFMYRDLLILEKNNYALSQFENLQKYNIYQSWGLDNLPLQELIDNNDVLENLKKIKLYIENNF